MLSHHSQDLPSGTVLREWQLDGVLALSQLGTVYAAHGLYFDEPVAIKAYSLEAAKEQLDAGTAVQTASSLEGHVLSLIKVVEEARRPWGGPLAEACLRSAFEIHGTSYMVMDLRSGTSLAHMLENGDRFTEEDLLALIWSIAEGVERAHRVGVLHGDIRPANILVYEDGTTIAAGFNDSSTTATELSRSPYAAIEQGTEASQGPWTDIYALGAVLYECVTGQAPMAAGDRLIRNGELLTDREWPGFSHGFLQAIDAALRISPWDRPQSIWQWLDLLASPDDTPARAYGTSAASLPEVFDESFQATKPIMGPVVSKEMPGFEPLADTADFRPRPQMKSTAAPSAPRLRRTIPAAAILASFAVGSLFFWSRGEQPTVPANPLQHRSAQFISQPTAQTGTGTFDLASFKVLEAQMAALIAEARRALRPQSELHALEEAAAKFSAQIARAQALAALPHSANDLEQQVAVLNRLASEAGRMQASAIARDADVQNKKVQQVLSRIKSPRNPQKFDSDEQMIAKALLDTRTGLDENVATALAVASPAETISAARRSLELLSQFKAALAAARTYVRSSLRSEFFAVEASARQRAANVIEMGRVKKPGLFAGRERRKEWRLRKSNAAMAETRLHELGHLAQTVGTAPLDRLERTVDRARGVTKTLARLETSSWAAMPKEDGGLF